MKSDRARLPVLDKELAVDVLPRLEGLNGWTQEKLEGLTIAGNGHLYSVTDNDGVKDASGETVFLDLGSADEIFDLQDDRRGGPGRGRGPRAHVR